MAVGHSSDDAQFLLGANKNSDPGFTLVQLLVVVAAIGILVSLLLPAIQAAQRRYP